MNIKEKYQDFIYAFHDWKGRRHDNYLTVRNTILSWFGLNYKIVRIKSLEKQYYDKDTLLLHVNFQLLVDFVEQEVPSYLKAVECEYTDFKTHAERYLDDMEQDQLAVSDISKAMKMLKIRGQ